MARSFLLKIAALVSSALLVSSTGAANTDPAVVDLVHTSGSSAKIAVFGAQVTSFCTSDDPTVNVLFMPKNASTDGLTPSRGGIAVVFPNYGAMAGYNSVPDLGFARTTKWNLDSVSQYGEGVSNSFYSSAYFSLVSSDATRQMWPFDFRLIYEVHLSTERLVTRLTVINTGATAIDFQALLNNHFSVPDVRDSGVVISGLQGVKYIDRVTKTNQTSPNVDLSITSRVDRIYKGVEGSVVAHVRGGDTSGRDVVIEKTSRVGDGGSTPLFTQADYVVSNPWTEGSAAANGAGSDEYLHMVAIGVGGVSERMMVAPTMSYVVDQIIRVAMSPTVYELD